MGAFGHSDVHLEAIRITTGEKHNPRQPDTKKDKRQEEEGNNPNNDGVRALASEEKNQSSPVSILHPRNNITLEFGDQEMYDIPGQKIDNDSESQQVGQKQLSCRIK